MVNYTWFLGNKGEPKYGIIYPSLESWLRWHYAIENKSKKIKYTREKIMEKPKKVKKLNIKKHFSQRGDKQNLHNTTFQETILLTQLAGL